MFKWIDRTFIKPVEDSKTSLGAFVLIAYGYMVVRNVLEGMLEGSALGVVPATISSLEMVLLHFPLFYFLLFFVAIIGLHFTTGTDIRKVTRVLLVYSFIILVPPIIDALIRPGGFKLAYPGDPRILWEGLKSTLGLGSIVYGSSPGMLTEAYLGVLLAAVYGGIRAKGTARKILAAVLSALVLFGAVALAGGIQVIGGLVFAHGTSMADLAALYNSGGLISSPSRKYALLLLLVLIPVVLLGLWLYNRKNTRALFSALKPFPLALSGLAAGLGYLLGWLTLRSVLVGVPRNPFDFIAAGAAVIAGVAAASACCFLGRAEASGDESKRKLYRRGAAGLFVISLLFAWCLGYTPMFIFMAYFVTALVRYMPPLKLSRFAVTSSLCEALGLFILVLVGYSLFGMERTLNVFPWQLWLATFFPLWALVLGRELILRRAHPKPLKEG